MLNYAETASSSTIVPLVLQSQCQQGTTFPLSAVSSYAIAPMHAAQIVTMQVHPSDGEACTQLIPTHLPLSILNDPAFRDGYEWNYLSEEEGEEQEEWTTSVPRLVNHIYFHLTDTHCFRDLHTGKEWPDFLPWQVGWLLRDLTRLAETDRTLAYIGMAHLCFLLPLLTQERPPSWPRGEPYHAYFLHLGAVKAYRGRVLVYREQGKSFAEAQRLALG